MVKRSRINLASIILALTTATSSAAVIYVDGGAVDGGDTGGDWTDAYLELQSALNAAQDGDEIRVAAGTYKPDYDPSTQAHTLDRDATFELKNGVTIYGGFPSGGGTMEERHPGDPANGTILTGDLNGDDEPSFVNYDENSYHVLESNTDVVTAVLDGFVITGGNADGYPDTTRSGAGIFVYDGNSTPTLRNCTFRANSCQVSGSAIQCGHGGGGSNPIIINCVIIGNRSDSSDGGAIHVHDSCSPTVTNCTICYNSSGIRSWGDPNITNCILWGNGVEISVASGTLTVSYSDVQGGYAECDPCIDSDPLFVDVPGPDGIAGTADDDPRLSNDSPCIDAGNNDADIDGSTPELDPLPDTDLDGNPRRMDNPLVDDCQQSPGSCGLPPVVDMGAYENVWQDCNTNGIPDECDIDCGTSGGPCDLPDCGQSQDCQPNGTPDECEPLVVADLLSEEFDGGLPVDWVATGLWHVTSDCPAAGGTCGSVPWAYFGDDVSCTFDTGAPVSGSLVAGTVSIPANADSVMLQYCSTYEGNRGTPPTGYDSAWLTVNGELFDSVSDTTAPGAEWETRTVDLISFLGESVELAWHFDSIDEVSNDFLGWLVDKVEIVAEVNNDCNSNGVLDGCETLEAGDFNDDDVVDLVDYEAMVDCFTGPNAVPNPLHPGCVGTCLAAFDFDADGDVDAGDFAKFQADFTGPVG